MIQDLTFLFWREVVREDARPMTEPMRGVWLAERVVAVGLACVLGDLFAHDVAELAEAE
jgi:cytochrome c oxidase assembly factor CtaG